MRRIETTNELMRACKSFSHLQLSIGFVPTMGALHEGHLSLVRKSMIDNDKTVVSIFVNQAQFNKPEDFENYPNTLERDIKLLTELGVDIIFTPNSQAEMYPDGFTYKISEAVVSQDLCGIDRPGHFTGVLTVVMKLLMLVRANRVYFGEKDFQQLQLIRGLVDAFFLDVEVIACKTVREKTGLALSSRNSRLGDEARQKAAVFPEILRNARSISEAQSRLEELGYKVEYIKEKWGRRFGAISLLGADGAEVRLIDNVKLPTMKIDSPSQEVSP